MDEYQKIRNFDGWYICNCHEITCFKSNVPDILSDN